jgi:hypothetical protein
MWFEAQFDIEQAEMLQTANSIENNLVLYRSHMIHLYFHNITIFQELVREEADPTGSACHDSGAFP